MTDVVNLATVAARVQRGRRWVMRQVAAGKFPKPLGMYGRPMWKASTIDAWLDGRWGQSKFFASARRHELKVAGQ